MPHRRLPPLVSRLAALLPMCALGAGLDKTGRLSAEAIDRAVHALRRFDAIAKAMKVENVPPCIATEATRRASNGSDLIDAIRESTGLETRLLTGSEEASYAAMGVISGFFQPKGLAGDLGGGSLEVAEIIADRVGERTVSMPLGALPVKAMMEDRCGSSQEADRQHPAGKPSAASDRTGVLCDRRRLARPRPCSHRHEQRTDQRAPRLRHRRR